MRIMTNKLQRLFFFPILFAACIALLLSSVFYYALRSDLQRLGETQAIDTEIGQHVDLFQNNLVTLQSQVITLLHNAAQTVPPPEKAEPNPKTFQAYFDTLDTQLVTLQQLPHHDETIILRIEETAEKYHAYKQAVITLTTAMQKHPRALQQDSSTIGTLYFELHAATLRLDARVDHHIFSHGKERENNFRNFLGKVVFSALIGLLFMWPLWQLLTRRVHSQLSQITDALEQFSVDHLPDNLPQIEQISANDHNLLKPLAAAVQSFHHNLLAKIHAEERLKDEQSQQQSQQLILATIAEQSPNGILLLDCSTLNFIQFNDSACTMLGYTREEFQSMTLYDVMGSRSATGLDQHIAELIASGGDLFETDHRRKDGSICYLRISDKILEIDGKTCISGIWIDITELKQAN